MGLKQIIISFMLIGLFAIAIINFGVQIAIDNNSNLTITDDPDIQRALDDLTIRLGDTRSQVEGNTSVIESDESEVTGEGAIVPKSIKTIGIAFYGFPKAIINILVVPLKSRLGIPDLVIVVLGAIVGLMIVFSFWRWLRTGN